MKKVLAVLFALAVCAGMAMAAGNSKTTTAKKDQTPPPPKEKTYCERLKDNYESPDSDEKKAQDSFNLWRTDCLPKNTQEQKND